MGACIEMILILVANIALKLSQLLTAVFKIPGMPDGIKEVVSFVVDYIGEGLSILAVYLDLPYLLMLFGLIAMIDTAIHVWNLLMFVLKKIPFIAVK